MQASLLPCLTHQYHGCPEVGEWPTLVSGACPDGWDRSRLGVCYQRSSLAGGAQNWRCPLTAQRLQHPPFCAPSEAMIASKHDLSYPVLRCYALRYTDLQRVFCQGRRMKLLQNCRWQQILQHYRVYGNLEGRKLDCEGVTLDHEYMSDPRYPHVLLSSSTANMLSRQPGNLAQMRPSESLPQQPRAPSSIISGSVCGGLTNQRLALIDLLVIGYLLKATVVLPELNLNGRQTGQRYQESRSQLAPFTTFFDFDKTQANLADLVHVVLGDNRTGNASEGFSPLGYLDPRISPDISVHGSLRNPRWYAKALKRERSSQSGASGSTDQHGFALTHLRFDCTLMSVQKDTPEMQNLFWRLDAALVPSEKIARVANKTIRKLRSLSNASGGSGLYTSLHLRVENDWVEHCARWESVHSYPRRDNCMTNTDRLGSVFAIEGVDEKQPVYVATEETGKQLSHVRGMDGLSRYRAASKSTLYAPGDPDAQWLINHRELSAFHDLIVCAQSNRFIGNSVSTFSAYLELMRLRIGSGPDDFHYNGGPIPLSVMFGGNTPTRRLKWVFVVNADATPTFVEAARVAVASALKNTKLVPICIHLGPLGRVAALLEEAGVHVIEHRPAWTEFIAAAARSANLHVASSTNFFDPRMMLSTFLRIDIPILGFVDEYILYADADVLFVGPLGLEEFTPLPAYYAIGTEIIDATAPGGIAFGNAGVMLFNLPAMRRTQDAFVRWTFREEHVRTALNFGKYGPLDQGAYNAFYQGRFDVHRSPVFNWKPYWGYSSGAKLIHFHGPKIPEYLAHAKSGVSLNPAMVPILNLCDRAQGCFKYVQEWLHYNRSLPNTIQPRRNRWTTG